MLYSEAFQGYMPGYTNENALKCGQWGNDQQKKYRLQEGTLDFKFT